MATRKEKVHLFRNINYGGETLWFKPEFTEDYILIGIGECEFELLPDDEQVKAAVESLEAAKQKERAESQVRMNNLDARIQSLLAISHDGGGV